MLKFFTVRDALPSSVLLITLEIIILQCGREVGLDEGFEVEDFV